MSTRIDLSFTDERLLRDSKRRTAANQQALDDRTQTAKDQQAAEQAAEQATPEERPSGVPDIRLERRPSAQRRKDFKLDPVVIKVTQGPVLGGFTYTVSTGSRGPVFGVTPLTEPGLPSLSEGLIPGHKEAFLQAWINRIAGVDQIQLEPVGNPSVFSNKTSEFLIDLGPARPVPNATNVGLVGEGIKKYYGTPVRDSLVGSFVADNILNLIFYRSFVDAYEVTYTATYTVPVGGVPTVRLFEEKFFETARKTTDCFVVTVDLNTGASTKNSFLFHDFNTTSILKCAHTWRNDLASGYVFWRAATENILTGELLTFLYENTYTPQFNFTLLPVYTGETQTDYTYTFTDNVSDVIPPVAEPFTETSLLNPTVNGLTTKRYHGTTSFLPYFNPLYVRTAGRIQDTYGFIDYPRWDGYDSKTGIRVISAGSTAQPVSRDLLEISETTKPTNVADVKRLGYPWPQSFNTYNAASVSTVSAVNIFNLDSFSNTDINKVLAASAPKFIAVAKDLTAPNVQPYKQQYAVNGPGIVFAVPPSIRLMYRIVYR
jgi:hypothetical protein